MPSSGDRARLHEDRAMEELDLALGAGSLAAARAHLQLSSLHLDRMRDLREDRIPELSVPAE